MAAVPGRDLVLASADEMSIIRRLAALARHGDLPETEVIGPDQRGVPLPASARRLLARVILELSKGRGVSVIALEDADLTTQQAADLLNVSRPFLIQKLLDAGEIPYHYVGNRRRMHASDVLAYRERWRRDQEAALTEMARDAQVLGIYE